MKKRIIVLLSVTAMLLGALCGCKKENTEQPPEAGLEASLVIACQEEEAVLSVINDHIAQFQTAFPGVNITLDSTGEAEEAANILCGTPDQLVSYMKEDKLFNMDTWINDTSFVIDQEGTMLPVGLTSEQQSDLVELYFEEGRQFEKKGTYMLPLYRESQVVYFNRTYFEENELEIPYTWEIVEKNCQWIKEKNPDAKPLVCKDVLGLFLSLSAQYGAEYTAEGGVNGLLATEGALKSAKLLNGWYQKGYLTTEDLSLQDPGVYMVLDASSDLQLPEEQGDAYSFELGVMNMPSPEEVTGRSLATGVSIAMLRTDDDDQMLAAWLFAKSMCTDVDFQAELAMAGSFTPVLTSVEVYEKYSEYLDNADGGENIGALVALSCMEQQHKLFTAPTYEGSLEEKEKLTALVEDCMQAADGVEAILEKGIS